MKNEITKKLKFTVRPDKDQAMYIRLTYEQQRQQSIMNGDSIPSLNQYICEILTRGIESIASEPKTKTRKEP